MGYMQTHTDDSDDDVPSANLSLEEFQQVALAWRKKARGGDLTTGMIADALESVLRRRIITAREKIRAREVAAAGPTTWWKLW